jgi:hypothetical protein
MTGERNLGNLDLGDLYIPSEESQYRVVVTPRVIALSPSGSFPMVNIGGWLGLPGGKIKVAEGEGNLLSSDVYGALITFKHAR